MTPFCDVFSNCKWMIVCFPNRVGPERDNQARWLIRVAVLFVSGTEGGPCCAGSAWFCCAPCARGVSARTTTGIYLFIYKFWMNITSWSMTFKCSNSEFELLRVEFSDLITFPLWTFWSLNPLWFSSWRQWSLCYSTYHQLINRSYPFIVFEGAQTHLSTN